MQIQKSFATTDQGTLFLVPTPIGNLDDMTMRSIKTLQEADLIAAEDTRNTGKLLAYFNIETPQISFHEHNTQQRIPELLAKLAAGVSIAQVSDAGLPSISDPGKELVKAAVAAGIAVVPLPGANAGLTALIASGISPQPFYFYGFLPRKNKELNSVLQQLAQRLETVILYESPHHLQRTLTDLAGAFGADRNICLGRELTKLHESFERGTIGELIDWYNEHDPRGEYVLIVSGRVAKQIDSSKLTTVDIVAKVDTAIAQGNKPNAAIKSVAQELQMPRQEIYRIYHEL
ncbi:16S rRNA (cytidine(1402)-2'-O)-methyltransferase [Lapidilactobacillus bayanensis]|uniref:16S rRNA (cytidine(1402)-2'-O)-methyltransferase n=1 Tax=Lapidilactobacillus bayanensis TaxID=2485998 RepID=UPI000F7A4A99|nr:16S rRNA (cytidine(1402)-2'-O)-methyltransferase [Lapidilactobacillus bayanensis]